MTTAVERPPADEAAFRADLRDWLSDNLTPEFRAAGRLTALTDDAHWDTRLAWERMLADAGWLGISWPTEHGGRDGSFNEEMVFLVEHFAAGAPLWAGVQGRDLLAPTLLRFGSPAIKDRFLGPIMRAEEFWGQGYSEPDAGSDLAGIRTTAVLRAGEWVIDGQKIWTSFGARADWLYVLCRTEPGGRPHEGLTLLLVPADQPGVDIRPVRHMGGSEDFCEVFLSGARTDESLVVGSPADGWRVVMGSLDHERFVTTLPYQAQFVQQFDDAVAEAGRRGRLTDPLVRQRLGEEWIGLRVNQLSNDRLVEQLLTTGAIGAESSLAKLRWASWHRGFANTLVDLFGADAMLTGGTDDAERAGRVFLNARAETIYGGTNEIQRNVVGERLLGLPRG